MKGSTKAIIVLSLTTLVLGIMLYLYSHQPTPDVIPVPTQQATIKHDTVIAKANYDSVQMIIFRETENADQWHNAFNIASNEKSILENSLTAYIATTSVPDTCKQFQQQIMQQFQQVVAADAIATKASVNTINTQAEIIKQKDVIIKNDSIAYRKMIANADTCLKQQTTLTKINKTLQPQHSLNVGLTAMSKYTLPLNAGIGVSLSYRNKKGTEWEAAIYTNKEVVVGVKIKLFNF